MSDLNPNSTPGVLAHEFGCTHDPCRCGSRDIDLTRPGWGHNFSILNWDKGEMFVWLTPGPREGDVLILQGKKGLIRARVEECEWQTNVDDMYRVRVVPDSWPTTASTSDAGRVDG